MTAQHRPEEHALIPALPPLTVGRRPLRVERRDRPPATYGCSCGRPLPGDSRRQARPEHQAHRKAVKA